MHACTYMSFKFIRSCTRLTIETYWIADNTSKAQKSSKLRWKWMFYNLNKLKSSYLLNIEIMKDIARFFSNFHRWLVRRNLSIGNCNCSFVVILKPCQKMPYVLYCSEATQNVKEFCNLGNAWKCFSRCIQRACNVFDHQILVKLSVCSLLSLDKQNWLHLKWQKVQRKSESDIWKS